MSSDDDIYNDVLDESFEFDDEDYDDVDLDLDLDSDDYDDEMGVEDEAVSSSRKGFDLDFNTIVIIGAVIVGGMIMMYQVSSKKPAPKAAGQEKFATALQMKGAFEGPGAIGEEAVTVPEEVDEDEGFLFNNDSIDLSEENTLPAPSPIEENALPMPSPIMVSSDSILQTSEENIEVVAAEEAVPIVEPEVLVTEVARVEPDVQEPQIVASETVNIEATKLQSMLSRIETMERQMTEVQQSHRAEIRTMEEKIASLKKSQAKAIKPRSSASQPQKKSKASKKVAAVKKRWELRAAQPGRAWVSLKGQKDMRPIVVGDKLSGIGRIQNITYTNGRWIVQGSTGKITQ